MIQMKSYELAVTNECNWNCKYCLVDTHNKKPLVINKVIEKIKQLPDNISVTLSGGEPGMLNEEDLLNVIELLESKNCVIDLVTNGLFLFRYEKYTSRVNEVLYHCIEDIDVFLKENKKIKLFDKKPHGNFELIYVIVVLFEDFESGRIQKIIDLYPEIKFMLSPNKLITENKIFNSFLEFIHKNKEKIHERTLSEFIKNKIKI